ncbi:MAG: hypothetical protein HZY74_10575 [Brevundimonas sp.]|nr:MAG: hypothetical protein HZY74_10575 [Brevundimonas sp.]
MSPILLVLTLGLVGVLFLAGWIVPAGRRRLTLWVIAAFVGVVGGGLYLNALKGDDQHGCYDSGGTWSDGQCVEAPLVTDP